MITVVPGALVGTVGHPAPAVQAIVESQAGQFAAKSIYGLVHASAFDIYQLISHATPVADQPLSLIFTDGVIVQDVFHFVSLAAQWAVVKIGIVQKSHQRLTFQHKLVAYWHYHTTLSLIYN